MTDYHSEDSLDPGKANLAFRQCYKYALHTRDHEVGGYFYLDSDSNFLFRPCKNLNTIDKDQYNFRDVDFYKHYINNQIIGLFHTHIEDDPSPSALDLANAHSFRLPSYILSVSSKKSYLFYPDNYIPTSINNRQFIALFQDCLTYMKDYLLLNFNINLNNLDINWARPKLSPNQIMLNYFNLHFNEIDHKEYKNGDVLVFPESISEYLHVGVVDKDNHFFHHPIYRYPDSELITQDMLNKVYKIYRYKD
jgi:proteasome lid subunit RPN8/RPN11